MLLIFCLFLHQVLTAPSPSTTGVRNSDNNSETEILLNVNSEYVIEKVPNNSWENIYSVKEENVEDVKSVGVKIERISQQENVLNSYGFSLGYKNFTIKDITEKPGKSVEENQILRVDTENLTESSQKNDILVRNSTEDLNFENSVTNKKFLNDKSTTKNLKELSYSDNLTHKKATKVIFENEIEEKSTQNSQISDNEIRNYPNGQKNNKKFDILSQDVQRTLNTSEDKNISEIQMREVKNENISKEIVEKVDIDFDIWQNRTETNTALQDVKDIKNDSDINLNYINNSQKHLYETKNFESKENVNNFSINFNNSKSTDFDIWGDGVKQNYVLGSDIKNVTNFSRFSGNRSSRVLNFFPIPVEEECSALDGHRKGICMNTYECRIQGGKSSGTCALGFGVCCVFIMTCEAEVFNNITYFVNPDYPGISRHMSTCEIKIKKIDPEISQFRLDFIHFHLGQPNRRTGICDDDIFVMGGGNVRELKMCGLNSGQHVYYDVENIDEPVSIKMNLNKRSLSRLWEIRVIQVPFTQRAPSGCLQYHTGMTGVIQTMNFADNGRHLANQDYNICMRQEVDMCSITYQPCYENSFKIGPAPLQGDFPGGVVTNSGDLPGGVNPGVLPGSPPGTPPGGSVLPNGGAGPAGGAEPGGGAGPAGGAAPVEPVAEAPPVEPVVEEPPVAEDPPAEEPVDDTLADDVSSSGDGPIAEGRMALYACNDRIIMPCDSEDLIMPGISSPGMCDLVHCGTSFCPPNDPLCKVESTVTPFTIGVQFGHATKEESPEDNLGMCLFYEQLPCAV